jgi:hypothetical protein
MDSDVFRARVAPLLTLDELLALRRVSRLWQLVVDELVPVKGAFGLRRKDDLTMADVRYAHVHLLDRLNPSYAVAACVDDMADLEWALATFGAPARLSAGVLARVARIECMELLIRVDSADPADAFSSSCAEGHIDVAQWLARHTFDLRLSFKAVKAGATELEALRASCTNGHLAVAKWLTSAFRVTDADARSLKNAALRGSCANGHLAVAKWLVRTFGLTDDDIHTNGNEALRVSCKNGHLAVAQWLTRTSRLSGEEIRSIFNEVVVNS